MVKRSKDASAVAFTILYYKWLELPTYICKTDLNGISKLSLAESGNLMSHKHDLTTYRSFLECSIIQ